MSFSFRKIAFGFVFLTIWSCTENRTQKPLNNAQRKEITQMYADSVRKYSPIYDSLCLANTNKLVYELADSIYQVRLADLKLQRKRFSQE